MKSLKENQITSIKQPKQKCSSYYCNLRTNLTNKLDAYKKLQDHKPKLIPIINPEAKVHIYANYRINNKDKLSNLIILSKKLMR